MRGFQEPMACQGMHLWTFTGLVGAFVDLVIAYFLLCASAVSFFASKFLGFFGLCLPCPCNGLFENPNSNHCLQRLLVDGPIERVSSVQLSVKSKFPFGSTWERDRNYQLNLKFVRDSDSCIDGFVEMEGEASCSSNSGTPKKSDNMAGRDLVLMNESNVGLGVVNSPLHFKEERFDLKGKRNMNQRPRSGLRRRRKVATDYGKVSSVFPYNPSCSDGQSSYGSNHTGYEAIECSSVPFDSGVDLDHVHYDEDLVLNNTGNSTSPGLESVDENKPAARNTSSSVEIKSSNQIELPFNGDERNAIRTLEQALEGEHAVRSALQLELEKERSAAATAADEAMAMILRLQEEKASIEMEARQFQRMIEEKSAYDAEEMNILKEIIVRREREKHFMEKEVEAYRATVCDGNQQLQDDDIQNIVNMQSGQLASTLDLSEDPVLMLQQLCESIDNKERVKDKNLVNEVSFTDMQKYSFTVGDKLEVLGQNQKVDFSTQEGIDTPISTTCDGQSFADKIVILSAKQEEENDNASQPKGVAVKSIEIHDVTDIHITQDGEDSKQHVNDEYQGSKDPADMILDMDTHVHDIHVIDNKSHLLKGTREDKCEGILENDNSSVPGTSKITTEAGIVRSSSSSMIVGLPPLGGLVEGKPRASDRGRNSMSVVDNERIRIDSEVDWLRERLRIVQEGREKLNFSMERREREKFQVQLLEDIACQLREIQQRTNSGNAVRQASLPLPIPKVMSKKRRHRSVSLGVHKSS